MEALNLTKKQLKELFFEELLLDENDNELFEMVETEDWSDEGKYSHTFGIFKDMKTGKHYRFSISRSGSYFSYYEFYFNDDIEEVELKEVVIKKKAWVRV